jgi:hypothetical protein
LVGVIKTIKMLLYVLGKYLLFLKQTVLRRGKRTKMQFLRRVINPERGRTGASHFSLKNRFRLICSSLREYAKKNSLKITCSSPFQSFPHRTAPAQKNCLVVRTSIDLKWKQINAFGTIIECVISTFTAD